MFIKTLLIKNYKCFNDDTKPLEFNLPDGQTAGSGLNILVGENNSGKSTVFEAIAFLRDGTKKNVDDIKNKQANETDNISVELIFSGKISDVIDNYSQPNKKDVFKKYIYTDNNNEYFKLTRNSADIKAIQLWYDEDDTFKNLSGIDAPLKKLFEMNFVWSDTNPNDQAAFGSTTICGNLLKEIASKFEETDDYKNFSSEFHNTFNNEHSGLRKELKSIEERTQDIFAEQFGDAVISFHFNELKIDSFFKNTKIEINDGVSTFMEEKGSGMQRSVALALLQVYAEELVKHPDEATTKKPFYLFIDEPEICLHPQAQKKLYRALLELSKNQQIFLTTHSPYFCFPGLIEQVHRFKKSKDDVITVNKLVDEKLKRQLKNNENRCFFFRHRDLFFSNIAIFVEGVNDYDRYLKYCENSDKNILSEHFYMMNGCDSTIFFENFCKQFNIDFYALVDKDFSVERSKWVRGNRQRFIRDIKEFIQAKDINFDGDKFKEEMEKELTERPRTNERKIEEIEIKGVKITKVQNKNIFVLKHGEVKDYLNENGTVVEDKKEEKEKELNTIFDYIFNQIKEKTASAVVAPAV